MALLLFEETDPDCWRRSRIVGRIWIEVVEELIWIGGR